VADILAGDPASGPDQGRLQKAEQYADRALALLDSYAGDDTDMASFLRVVTLDQYADLCKYRNDLQGAIDYKEKSREIIEPLAEKTGNLEYMDRSFQVSNNLGLFFREAGRDNAAIYHIDEAVRKARQLEKISPEFKGRLVHALSNKALVLDRGSVKTASILECYEVLLKLMKEQDIDAAQAWTLRNIGGEFSSPVYNIQLYTNSSERRPVFEKIYGKPEKGSDFSMFDLIFVPEDTAKVQAGCMQWLIILVFVICLILQKTGVLDIAGFLTARFGPHGTWYGIGVLAFLYLLTCIPIRK
jgi:tetratricopeptide (TPR) repeat protein